MSRKSQSSEEFRAEVARKFQDAIDHRFSSVAEAANDLGISRQRLHKYLRGDAIPQADLLLMAMKRWRLRIICFGSEFSHTEQLTVVDSDSRQLRLFPTPLAPASRPVTSNQYILNPVTRTSNRSVANLGSDNGATE